MPAVQEGRADLQARLEMTRDVTTAARRWMERQRPNQYAQLFHCVNSAME